MSLYSLGALFIYLYLLLPAPKVQIFFRNPSVPNTKCNLTQKQVPKKKRFDEAEVFQICECVRYFLTNRQPLSNTEIRISKRSTVTQIALKNFAWNIAYPYNMSGDTTAAFVFNTFNEWFVNTTIATIKKTLRTTNGRHKIEIDEKILSKYLGDNAK